MTAPGPISMSPVPANPSRRRGPLAVFAMPTFWWPHIGEGGGASRCVGFLSYLRQMRDTKHDGICRDLIPCLNCLSLNGSNDTDVYCIGVTPPRMYTRNVETIVRQRGKSLQRPSEYLDMKSRESACTNKDSYPDLDRGESIRATPRQTKGGDPSAPK